MNFQDQLREAIKFNYCMSPECECPTDEAISAIMVLVEQEYGSGEGKHGNED